MGSAMKTLAEYSLDEIQAGMEVEPLISLESAAELYGKFPWRVKLLHYELTKKVINEVSITVIKRYSRLIVNLIGEWRMNIPVGKEINPLVLFFSRTMRL